MPKSRSSKLGVSQRNDLPNFTLSVCWRSSILLRDKQEVIAIIELIGKFVIGWEGFRTGKFDKALLGIRYKRLARPKF